MKNKIKYMKACRRDKIVIMEKGPMKLQRPPVKKKEINK